MTFPNADGRLKTGELILIISQPLIAFEVWGMESERENERERERERERKSKRERVREKE